MWRRAIWKSGDSWGERHTAERNQGDKRRWCNIERRIKLLKTKNRAKYTQGKNTRNNINVKMTKPESPKTQTLSKTPQDHGRIDSLLLHVKSFHVKVLMNNEFRALGELIPTFKFLLNWTFCRRKSVFTRLFEPCSKTFCVTIWGDVACTRCRQLRIALLPSHHLHHLHTLEQLQLLSLPSCDYWHYY